MMSGRWTNAGKKRLRLALTHGIPYRNGLTLPYVLAVLSHPMAHIYAADDWEQAARAGWAAVYLWAEQDDWNPEVDPALMERLVREGWLHPEPDAPYGAVDDRGPAVIAYRLVVPWPVG